MNTMLEPRIAAARIHLPVEALFPGRIEGSPLAAVAVGFMSPILRPGSFRCMIAGRIWSTRRRDALHGHRALSPWACPGRLSPLPGQGTPRARRLALYLELGRSGFHALLPGDGSRQRGAPRRVDGELGRSGRLRDPSRADLGRGGRRDRAEALISAFHS